jgi:hypothetical protein
MSASAEKQRANRQSSFGPTCRLVSSPEAGPGATVGTLNQGYPLLQYEDAVPARLSLVVWWTAADPTTWTDLGPPRGRIRQYIPGYRQTVRTPWESVGPLYVRTGPPGKVQNLHGRARTPCAGSGPLTARSRDSRAKNTQALTKARRGSGADTCPDHIAYTSAPRSGGVPMLPRGRPPVT